MRRTAAPDLGSLVSRQRIAVATSEEGVTGEECNLAVAQQDGLSANVSCKLSMMNGFIAASSMAVITKAIVESCSDTLCCMPLKTHRLVNPDEEVEASWKEGRSVIVHGISNVPEWLTRGSLGSIWENLKCNDTAYGNLPTLKRGI